MPLIPGTIPETGARAKTKAMLNRHSALFRSARLQRSAGMRRRVGPHGERYTADVEEAESAGGMNFRGEWSADNTYKVNDVVVVRGGQGAGTYICVRANPPASTPQDPAFDPTQGVFWVALSRGPTWGLYL